MARVYPTVNPYDAPIGAEPSFPTTQGSLYRTELGRAMGLIEGPNTSEELHAGSAQNAIDITELPSTQEHIDLSAVRTRSADRVDELDQFGYYHMAGGQVESLYRDPNEVSRTLDHTPGIPEYWAPLRRDPTVHQYKLF